MKFKLKLDDLPSELQGHVEDAPNVQVKDTLMFLFNLDKSKSESQILKKDFVETLKWVTNRFLNHDEMLGKIKEDKKVQQLEEKVEKTKSKQTDSKSNEEQMTNPKSENDEEESNQKKPSICRYWKIGRCKKAEGCLFQHPPTCRKFISFGSKKHNPKGCDSKQCDQLHPKLCMLSLKGKCKREHCKFVHLSIANGPNKKKEERDKKQPTKLSKHKNGPFSSQLSYAQAVKNNTKDPFLEIASMIQNQNHIWEKRFQMMQQDIFLMKGDKQEGSRWGQGPSYPLHL